MIGLSQGTRIFLWSGPTDMRKSFNGLSGLVAEHFDDRLLSGDLFLFFNRRRDRVKILYWDRDGLAIWYKRLEAGTFQVTGDGENPVEVDSTELSLLLQGIDLASAKRRRRYRVA